MKETKPQLHSLDVMAIPKRRDAVSPLVFASFVCFAGNLPNRCGSVVANPASRADGLRH
jgi:hypothetical protein